MGKQPEGIIQKAILSYLKRKGIKAWSNKTQGTWDPRGFYRRNKTEKGIADILGVLPPNGRFLAIEVKTRTGKVTVEQRTFLDIVADFGGLAFVARSLEEAENAIDIYLEKHPQP